MCAFYVSLAVFFLTCYPRGQDSNSTLEQRLKAQFQGKVVTLRHFYAAAKLQFNPEGNLLAPAKEGSWTTCARIQIIQVNLNDQKLRMKGRRLLLQYDRDGKSFFDIAEDPSIASLSALKAAQQVSIEVSLTQGTGREDQLKSALMKVFLTSSENLSQVAPDIWKLFLSRMSPPTKEELAAATSKETMGYIVHTSEESGIIEPIPIRQSIPSYTTYARLARASGNIVILAVIDVNGKAIKPIIVVPLGLGLDESAIEDLSRWTFKPARLYGESVAFVANIEVTFQLYNEPQSTKK